METTINLYLIHKRLPTGADAISEICMSEDGVAGHVKYKAWDIEFAWSSTWGTTVLSMQQNPAEYFFGVLPIQGKNIK